MNTCDVVVLRTKNESDGTEVPVSSSQKLTVDNKCHVECQLHVWKFSKNQFLSAEVWLLVNVIYSFIYFLNKMCLIIENLTTEA